MSEKQKRDFKGIWIPKEIWTSKNLSITEKVFIAEIDSLDNESGCFASNSYFSEFFGLSKDRCSKIISELANKKIISIELIYDGKEVKKRIIKIIKNNYTLSAKTTIPYRRKQLYPIGENNYTLSAKTTIPYRRKQLYPIGENTEDITKNNNKELDIEILSESHKEQEKPGISYKEIKEFFWEKLEVKPKDPGKFFQINSSAIKFLSGYEMPVIEQYYNTAKADVFWGQSEIVPNRLMSAIKNGLKIKKINTDNKGGYKAKI